MDTTTTTSTTSTTRSATTTLNPLEQFYAFFVNPWTVIRFYQIGYTFIFLLGFIGNAFSLLTFSRSTLRKISTGCLFITLAISDVFYLLMCIFDYLEFGFSVPFYRRIAYSELCRFRSFIMSVAQFSSAWILVIISLDRWIRTRFPFKSGRICVPKHALIAVAVLIIIDIGLHAHMLTPMFGILLPGFANGACGPSLFNPDYMIFYYMTWTSIQIFTTCIVPAGLMLIILVDIFINIRLRKRAVVQPGQVNQQQRTIQKQMFILILASIGLFLLTNLPIGIYKIISPRGNVFSEALTRTSIYTGLIWFQSFNYVINFYIHCLTSTFFRKEFYAAMKILFRPAQEPTNTSVHVSRTGPQPAGIPTKY